MQLIPEADYAKLRRELAQEPRQADGAILAYGEVTGHKHQAHATDAYIATLPRKTGAIKVLDLPSGANVSHEEHPTHALKGGMYAFVQKRQYDSEKEGGWETVRD
jgi:hypothetical protein